MINENNCIKNEISLTGIIEKGSFVGTNDYEILSNKPQINGIELIGNKSLEDLGINSINFEVGNGLKMEDNTLMVDTAEEVEEDNTKPITSAAVYTAVGNIDALLGSI